MKDKDTELLTEVYRKMKRSWRPKRPKGLDESIGVLQDEMNKIIANDNLLGQFNAMQKANRIYAQRFAMDWELFYNENDEEVKNLFKQAGLKNAK